MATKQTPASKPRRLEDMSHGREGIFKLDFDLIAVEQDYNPRRPFEGIPELADDIHANGLRQPLIIRKLPNSETILLVDGERRWRAIAHLRATGRAPGPIRCSSTPQGLTDLDRLFYPLSCNSGRELTLLEKARHYLTITTAHELTAAEIARRSQTTKQAVSNALTLINSGSEKLLAAVEANHLSATTALGIIRTHFDHLHQDTALAATIAAALESGTDHAPPRHVPKVAPVAPEHNSPDPSFATPPPYYAPPETEDEDDENPFPPHPGADKEPPDPPVNPPADPGAYARLKNAKSTTRDGVANGPGEGFASPDKRLKNIEQALDELDQSKCDAIRWATVELVLDYLNGNHTIKTIKDHLKA